MQDQWKKIENYDGEYEISSSGKIKSINNKKYHLGCFSTKQKAHDAFCTKYLEVYGEKPW